jgi:hypothetical protein
MSADFADIDAAIAFRHFAASFSLRQPLTPLRFHYCCHYFHIAAIRLDYCDYAIAITPAPLIIDGHYHADYAITLMPTPLSSPHDYAAIIADTFIAIHDEPRAFFFGCAFFH